MGCPIVTDDPPGSTGPQVTPEIQNDKKRDIPLKLRLKVLDRDKYTCVFCGRTPALLPGVTLHIDHKVPFSKGGKTEFENLQTLCFDCNYGKGDACYNEAV